MKDAERLRSSQHIVMVIVRDEVGFHCNGAEQLSVLRLLNI